MAKRAENRETGDNGQHQLAVAPPPQPVKGGLSDLIEFSTEAQIDPNEGLNFGDTPVHCTCPHCERSVITFIDHETSWVTWVLGFVVWFSLGWMAFWVLPLLWPAFKDVVHHCPRCLNVVARKSRISLPTFRTEVMTCKIGSCAVVLARKYVMIAAGLIGIIITMYVLRTNLHLNTPLEMEKGPASMLTWEDFLFDCGPRTTLQHRATTARAFEDRYRRRTFKWQGEVRHIREGFDVWFLHTKSVVMIRMYPSRYPRRDLPDVALLFGEERNVEVAELNPGDWVEFEATMTAHGHRGDPEVMMLWHVKTVEKPSPLSSTPTGSQHSSEHQTPASHGKPKEAPSKAASAPPSKTGQPTEPVSDVTKGPEAAQAPEKAATEAPSKAASAPPSKTGQPTKPVSDVTKGPEAAQAPEKAATEAPAAVTTATPSAESTTVAQTESSTGPQSSAAQSPESQPAAEVAATASGEAVADPASAPAQNV